MKCWAMRVNSWANDADGYKSWLALSIEQLEREMAAEIESEWMEPSTQELPYKEVVGDPDRLVQCIVNLISKTV